MKNNEAAFHHFKKSYPHKMGGTQTVILPNGKSKFFDDRNYYKGNGKKFNRPDMHTIIGEVKVSTLEYRKFNQNIREQEKSLLIREIEEEIREYRYKAYHNKGLYATTGPNIDLSAQESTNHTFDPKKLAKTLSVKVSDAKLLNSHGKTYVFAKRLGFSGYYKLYHPSLITNNMSIGFEKVTEKDFEKFKEEWGEADQFAELLGQTANDNHFVC